MSLSAWTKKVEGKFIDEDGWYGSQCVDLWLNYNKYLYGSNWRNHSGWGNAKDYWKNAGSSWQRIKNQVGNASQLPKPGDVMVWGATGSNPYGHIAIVLSATSKTFVVLQQDGFIDRDSDGNADGVAHRKTRYWTSSIIGWLRPEGAEMLELSAPVFNKAYYLKINPDVKKAGIEPTAHWLKNGIKEGRKSAPNFHVAEYLANYGDLRRAFGSKGYALAIKHYYNNGIAEGRLGTKTTKDKLDSQTKLISELKATIAKLQNDDSTDKKLIKELGAKITELQNVTAADDVALDTNKKVNAIFDYFSQRWNTFKQFITKDKE